MSQDPTKISRRKAILAIGTGSAILATTGTAIRAENIAELAAANELATKPTYPYEQRENIEIGETMQAFGLMGVSGAATSTLTGHITRRDAGALIGGTIATDIAAHAIGSCVGDRSVRDHNPKSIPPQTHDNWQARLKQPEPDTTKLVMPTL